MLPTHTSAKDTLCLANDATLLDDAGRAAKAKRDKAMIECMRLLFKQMDVEATAPYTALEHYDAVYRASLEQWPNPDTWAQMMTKILQFYDVVGIDRQPLYEMFKEGQWMAVQEEAPEKKKNRTLLPDESAALRNINKTKMVPKALEVLQHPDITKHDKIKGELARMAHVHGALESCVMYGSKDGHTLFRNDLVTLQFKTTLTNLSEDNWVAKNEDGDWCFYMNTLHKVNPSGKNHKLVKLDETQPINVSQTNPLLANLLDKYEPVCRKIHGWGTEQSETRRKAWLVFQYLNAASLGTPLKSNALTQRN